MKKFIIALLGLAVMVPLAGCATPPSLQPATYANTTAADEFTATTAELAYKSWRLAATTGVQSGLIKGKAAASVAAIDNKLYAALQIVEHAYAGANAATIKSATDNFNSVLSLAYADIGGK